MCSIYHVCFLGAANSMISYRWNGLFLLLEHKYISTGYWNLKVFSWSWLDFPSLLSYFLLLYRCFLSDSCRHPGGHTWSALHLEHLQAVIARQSPLHTWYTRCSPHGERGKRNKKYLHGHWLFPNLKSSWISCSYQCMVWAILVKAKNTHCLCFVDIQYLNIFYAQDQANCMYCEVVKKPPVGEWKTLHVTQSYHLGNKNKNNTIVSQEACSENMVNEMHFHDITFLQDISIILITAWAKQTTGRQWGFCIENT